MSYLLVIDDDSDFAQATARVLESDGHEVETKLEIEAGLESLREQRPDLLILDVMFPEDAAAGFEAARKVKSMGKEYRNMPVLLLTAVNQRFPLGFGPDDMDDQWLPVSDFLEKPVDFDVLRKKVEHMLSEAESGDE